MGGHLWWGVIAWNRIIRSLADHTVSSAIRLRHTLLIPCIGWVRRANLRTAVMRCGSSEWRLWPGRWHAITSWYKGLCHWVETMVSVVAPGNGVLALGIMWIGMSRQLTECIRDARMHMRG